jgi:hypothetical protein
LKLGQGFGGASYTSRSYGGGAYPGGTGFGGVRPSYGTGFGGQYPGATGSFGSLHRGPGMATAVFGAQGLALGHNNFSPAGSGFGNRPFNKPLNELDSFDDQSKLPSIGANRPGAGLGGPGAGIGGPAGDVHPHSVDPVVLYVEQGAVSSNPLPVSAVLQLDLATLVPPNPVSVELDFKPTTGFGGPSAGFGKPSSAFGGTGAGFGGSKPPGSEFGGIGGGSGGSKPTES